MAHHFRADRIAIGRIRRRLAPSPVAAVPSGTTQVAVVRETACAVVQGAVKCWGSNEAGELGDGKLVDAPIPVNGRRPR